MPQHLDPEKLANNLVAVWDGLQLQWLIDPSGDTVRTMEAFFGSVGVVTQH